MNKDELNAEIQKGLDQIAEGKTLDSKEAMARIKNKIKQANKKTTLDTGE